MNDTERDDVCWEQSLELLDLAPGDLLLAERKLENAGQAALPIPEIEALVTKVTQPPRRLVPVARRVRAAALLVGTLCLAAFVMWLIWPRGQMSRKTMTYQMAIDLLELRSQPTEDRLLAWRLARGLVFGGIETLQTVRDDREAPRSLSESAKYELTLLRDVASTPDLPKPVAVDDSVKLAVEIAIDPGSPLEDRVKAVVQVGAQTKSGLISLLRARGFPEHDEPYLKRDIANARAMLER